MSLAQFLDDLFSTGKLKMPASGEIDEEDVCLAQSALAAWERQCRKEAPGEAPPFALPAAHWAATRLFHACRFFVYRDLGQDQLEKHFAAPSPPIDSPSSHYSVDLTLRFLPDVLSLVRAASQDDPLTEKLKELAAQWPLSSVGVSEVVPTGIEAIVSHPCLLRAYVDRILQRQDISRLNHPRVREAARRALGLHGELAPKVAEALKEDAHAVKSDGV